MTQVTNELLDQIERDANKELNHSGIVWIGAFRAVALVAKVREQAEELSIWKSVFPDIAPDRVMPDRSKLEAELTAARARIAELENALCGLMDIQPYSKGWDNGVTDSTGTINEADHWHGIAMDAARTALEGKSHD